MATARSSRALTSFVCSSCRQRPAPITSQHRTFTTTSPSHAEPIQPSTRSSSSISQISNTLGSPSQRLNSRRGSNDPSTPARISQILNDDPTTLTDSFTQNLQDAAARRLPHRLHVYATKHNTHITFVQPARPATETASSSVSQTSASAADRNKLVDVLLSVSTGNIGFRKAGRGSYDAAYQLGAYVMKQIQEKGMLKDVRALEVVLRGFGAGREAVTKVLMGAEGRRLRPRISAVVDATRLKQGGPRSKKPRRLG